MFVDVLGDRIENSVTDLCHIFMQCRINDDVSEMCPWCSRVLALNLLIGSKDAPLPPAPRVSRPSSRPQPPTIFSTQTGARSTNRPAGLPLGRADNPPKKYLKKITTTQGGRGDQGVDPRGQGMARCRERCGVGWPGVDRPRGALLFVCLCVGCCDSPGHRYLVNGDQ